jgi:hypothetical protein
LQSINWADIVKKQAKSIKDEDLGKVQEVNESYLLVQRGTISKDKFFIPVDMIDRYDGNVLRFKISEEDATARFLKTR